MKKEKNDAAEPKRIHKQEKPQNLETPQNLEKSAPSETPSNHEELQFEDEVQIEKNQKPKSFMRPVVKFLRKLLFKAGFIALLIVLALAGGKIALKKFTEIKTEKSHAFVFKELEKCAELVTAKTTYTDVISIKKTRIAGLAKSFSIVKYTGVMRAGLHDIREAEIFISDGGKKVKVILPPMEILSNDISSIEVFDEGKSVFVEISVKEIMEEIRFNQETSSAQILETGFLEESKKQAVKILESVLYAAGFKEVEIL